MSRGPRALIAGAVCAGLLAGCAGGGRAPVVSRAPDPAPQVSTPREPAPAASRVRSAGVRPPVHVVERGDTLYSIAWRYGLDYRTIAAWNALASPDRIMVGQRLMLRPSTPPAPAARPPNEAVADAGIRPLSPAPVPGPVAPPAPPPAATVASPAATPPVPATAPPPRPAGATRWQWPARGKVRQTAGASGRYGIVINGAAGQPVNAAAAGQVVYSGSGLIGYGKLIIIKHDDTFLSAYAHNDKLLVSEGAYVTAGQQIAEMGSSGAREVMLRFEIRRNGKPVPPLDYLPKS